MLVGSLHLPKAQLTNDLPPNSCDVCSTSVCHGTLVVADLHLQGCSDIETYLTEVVLHFSKGRLSCVCLLSSDKATDSLPSHGGLLLRAMLT